LVAAAAPPRRQLAAVVPAAGSLQLFGERLVGPIGRDLVERLDALKAAASRRRFVVANRHRPRPRLIALTRPRGSPARFRRPSASPAPFSSPSAVRKTAP